MERFTEETKLLMQSAEELAKLSGGVIGTEHLLCSMIKLQNSNVSKILVDAGFDENCVKRILKTDGNVYASAELSPRCKNLLQNALILALNTGYNLINCEHILFLILQDASCYAVRALKALSIDLQSIAMQLQEFFTDTNDNSDASFEQNDGYEREKTHNGKGSKVLDKLGVDLTQKAEEGKLDPVIGRGEEIDRIIQILSRRTKNNPVLIGEAGVGKSAIVEGLANAIIAGNVPEMLKGKRVFSLDLSSLVAGTKYRGEFEEKLQKAIAEIKKAGNIILFIDEIHNLVGAGGTSDGAMDAGNILKPMLARGELQTIGATTITEYRKHFEKDAALERRFQPIMVNPPNIEDTIAILKGLRDKYEAHHKVSISDEAITSAVILSDRYITDRFLPDKAIDLIDEACSKKRISGHVLPDNIKELEDKLVKIDQEMNDFAKRQEYLKAGELKQKKTELETEIKNKKEGWKSAKSDVSMSIGESEIADIVSHWTGVPVVKLTETEAEKLINLEEILKKRVIGQEEAVERVSRAVRRARAGLKDPKRPIGSFIFLGPTGVGKTELSKALAEAMFGDENLMIRVDMSEYMEKFNVSKLIGSAPGYVGYDEGGQLTEQVRRKPYSVVLFDEIEKAHPDVFNILLQIMEDGRLTDSHGRVISFKNTIIIMTSNIGASEISKMPKLGFSGGSNSANEYENMKEKQLEALKHTMKPEFINRIDDIIIFHKLDGKDLEQIVKIMINDLAKRLKEQGINIEVTNAAESFIVKSGSDNDYGARPLRRAVRNLIENQLSEEILKGQIATNDNIVVNFNGEKLTFEKTMK